MVATLDLVALRSALKELVLGVERQGLNVYERPTMRPMFPAVVIDLADEAIDYQSAMAQGLATVEFTLRLMTGDGEQAQIKLDELLSAGSGHGNSVIDAIEAGKATARAVGTWSDVVVRRARWLGRDVIEAESQTVSWQAELDVTVYSPRRRS